MSRRPGSNRILAVAALAVVVSAVLSGCGAKADGSPAAAAGPSVAPDVRSGALEFSSCMREHGYDVPDPTFNDQGWPQFNEPDVRDNQQYKQARALCRTHLDAAAVAAGAPNTQETQDQLLAFARCVRERGVNMPDPTDGTFQLDAQLLDSPSWQPAAKACEQHLPAKYKGLANASNSGKGSTKGGSTK
jgi:hypothetical protein